MIGNCTVCSLDRERAHCATKFKTMKFNSEGLIGLFTKISTHENNPLYGIKSVTLHQSTTLNAAVAFLMSLVPVNYTSIAHYLLIIVTYLATFVKTSVHSFSTLCITYHFILQWPPYFQKCYLAKQHATVEQLLLHPLINTHTVFKKWSNQQNTFTEIAVDFVGHVCKRRIL